VAVVPTLGKGGYDVEGHATVEDFDGVDILSLEWTFYHALNLILFRK